MTQHVTRGTEVAPFPAFAAATIPTTKVLAIGSVTDQGTPDALGGVLPAEVRATVQLYLAGKIDQWYFRNEAAGVVFLMNCTTTAEARALLDALPLGVAGLMAFDLIPLGPLQALAMLLA
ncbi:MAG TPA: hypothetical protein VGD56_00585 [Gemmatirosa sp.]